MMTGSGGAVSTSGTKAMCTNARHEQMLVAPFVPLSPCRALPPKKSGTQLPPPAGRYSCRSRVAQVPSVLSHKFGALGPDERLWLLVVDHQVLLYRLFQILGAAVGTAPNLLFRNRGEPPFDLVDPGCTRLRRLRRTGTEPWACAHLYCRQRGAGPACTGCTGVRMVDVTTESRYASGGLRRA